MAYRSASVVLPRTTRDQVRVGVPVQDLSQMRPGDLVFIPGSDGTASAPGHVALYIGNDLAVHAPHQGEVVQLVHIASWHAMIASIRRLVP
jgi:cell wall-associated NlpC family hydrolase